jgi:hypothetical protein
MGWALMSDLPGQDHYIYLNTLASLAISLQFIQPVDSTQQAAKE